MSEKHKVIQELTLIHRQRCNILGLDISDPENADTPLRCAKADYEQFEKIDVNFTIFDNRGYDQMIVKPNLPFSTMCSHHLYPYFGYCDIGYIPDNKVCGLSKLARLVKALSKGAMSQEWLTQNIANFLDEKLQPKGVIVIMKARHTCETCRGVRNENGDSYFITSSVKGVFKDNKDQSRSEFLSLIKR